MSNSDKRHNIRAKLQKSRAIHHMRATCKAPFVNAYFLYFFSHGFRLVCTFDADGEILRV